MPSTGDHPARAGWRRRGAAVRLVAGVATLVVGTGWWLSATFASGPDVSWVAAEIDDLVIGVDVEGILASRDSSELGPPLVQGFYDFTIRFMAPEGSEIKQSAAVLKFDTSALDSRLLQLHTEAEEAGKNIEKLDGDTQQQLMTLELQLAEADANLSKARLQNDVPDDLRSANQAEIDRLDLEVAEVEVRSLQGRLTAAHDSCRGAARGAGGATRPGRASGGRDRDRDREPDGDLAQGRHSHLFDQLARRKEEGGRFGVGAMIPLSRFPTSPG